MTILVKWRSVSWSGKKKKKKKNGSKPDYYKLLGLQNERWMATENDIKLGAQAAAMWSRAVCRLHWHALGLANAAIAWFAAYRKVALEHHPDKAGAGITDEAEKARIDEYFVQVCR